MALDVDADYQVIDNPEAVTLKSRPSGDGTTVNVPWQAMRLPATLKERVYVGVEASVTAGVFVLLRSAQATMPKVGDKITDEDAVVWEVRSVEASVWRRSWRCVCTQDVS